MNKFCLKKYPTRNIFFNNFKHCNIYFKTEVCILDYTFKFF